MTCGPGSRPWQAPVGDMRVGDMRVGDMRVGDMRVRRPAPPRGASRRSA
jgi:hypothetical protein